MSGGRRCTCGNDIVVFGVDFGRRATVFSMRDQFSCDKCGKRFSVPSSILAVGAIILMIWVWGSIFFSQLKAGQSMSWSEVAGIMALSSLPSLLVIGYCWIQWSRYPRISYDD